MRLKDFLTAEERIQFCELQLELLEACSKKERTLIQNEINEILDIARNRYESYLQINQAYTEMER